MQVGDLYIGPKSKRLYRVEAFSRSARSSRFITLCRQGDLHIVTLRVDHIIKFPKYPHTPSLHQKPDKPCEHLGDPDDPLLQFSDICL